MSVRILRQELRKLQMQVINPLAICEELCVEVSSEDDEIRCILSLSHLEPLVERLESAGFNCTQIQKDYERNRCVASFEPTL